MDIANQKPQLLPQNLGSQDDIGRPGVAFLLLAANKVPYCLSGEFALNGVQHDSAVDELE